MLYHVEFYKQNKDKTYLCPIPYRSWITAIKATFDLEGVVKKTNFRFYSLLYSR